MGKTWLTARCNVFGLNKQLAAIVVPLFGMWLGKQIDDAERERAVTFRDKSALFGGRVKPGDPPTWPVYMKDVMKDD